MIYVVGRSFEEYSRWLRDEMSLGKIESTTDVKYIRDHVSLMGARLEGDGDDIIFLPGWEELPEARAIKEYAEMMMDEFPYSLTAAGKKDQELLQEEFDRVRARMLETGDPFVECED